MLTRQGWLVGLGGIALVVVGRLLGAFELFVVGTGAIALLVVTAAVVGLTRLDLEVAREVHPRASTPGPSAGRPPGDEPGSRDGPRCCAFATPSRAPGERNCSSGHCSPSRPRRPPTDSRPSTGASSRSVPSTSCSAIRSGSPRWTSPEQACPSSPCIRASTRSAPVPHTTGDDPHVGAEHPNSLGRTGEDFYALRHYVIGDDLRRVHWPATAHHDELMVRQDELPWQGRATVLVDVRTAHTTPESLELSISAAASIVVASWRREDLVRLVSTDGADSGFAAGHAQMESIMEHLATVRATGDGSFRRVLDRLSRSAIGGALVAVVSSMPSGELEALARLRTRYGSLTIVRFEPSSWDPDAPVEAPTAGPDVVTVTADAGFTEVWQRHVGRRSSPRRPAPTGNVGAAS
ncbi:MAG: DUF58 domain-containing protein [Acidimicrobiia bacterium]|nr:DUF58 domain-containing protein [Acidimicrobiia bacterium]